MRMMKIIAVLLCLIGAGAAAAALLPFGPSLTLLERYRVESGVKAKFNDPDSARFSDLRIIRAQDGVHVCGLVNAKNGFGGYGQPALFYGVISDGKFVLRAIDTEKPKFGEEPEAEAACKRMYPS